MTETEELVIKNLKQGFHDSTVETKSPIESYINGKSFVETSFSITSNWDVDTDDKKCTKIEQDNKTKKKVNICTESSNLSDPGRCSETSESYDKVSSISNEKCLMMSGTIKRGKKAGQSLDVRLNISREELEIMEANITAKEHHSKELCSLTNGLHIFLFTIICFPFAFIISSFYSFYIGTITWYSIFTYMTEEKNFIIKIVFSPLLILLYPFLIIIFTLGLGIYAGCIQISCSLSAWKKEIYDWEKGFYGWLCSVINLEECSPYEVVILTEIKVSNDDKTTSQDSMLS